MPPDCVKSISRARSLCSRPRFPVPLPDAHVSDVPAAGVGVGRCEVIRLFTVLQETPRQMPRPNLPCRWLLDPATVHHQRAAGVKTAALGGGHGARDLPLERGCGRTIPGMLRGPRGQESPGVRVMGAGVDARHGPQLGETTQIHHAYVVADVVHH